MGKGGREEGKGTHIKRGGERHVNEFLSIKAKSQKLRMAAFGGGGG